ncbi:ABC transporter permease [Pseudonocardia lacus]|uniref:ABC transporter permease n=1 Tax=Pseudonocardia lacus TaxID=2835865 RepID=UPI001BDC5827|nr:ABC transporter permease [Pseudonocardia lacus]
MAEKTVPARPRRAVLAHARHAARSFLRTPLAAFFTLAFPLGWLGTVVLVVGNQEIGPPGAGVRLAQLLTPVAAVFAVAMAAFVTPAVTIVLARERGELKRLRGTPSPPAAFLAGQVLCATVVALLGTAIMVAAGVLAFGVRVDLAELPGALVVLVVGIAALAALALGVAALVPTGATAQAATIGSVVVLGFVSDMFTAGGAAPGWLDAVGWFFPLRHLVAALRDPFDPFTADGFGWVHLVVVAAWGLMGALVALRAFRWEPHRGSRRAHAAWGAAAPRRRSALTLILGQLSYADRTQWRDPGAWFFAVVFPGLLFVVLGAVWGGAVFDGIPYPQALAPGLVAYGVAVTAFVNLPEATAVARDRGVLRRLRGTPLPAWAYLAGRGMSALGMGAITAALVLAAGVAMFDVRIAPRGVPALLLVLVLGTACLLALGTALAAAIRTGKAFSVVSLALLLPMSFLSGLFPFGAPEPAVVRAVASVFPLQHLGDALDEALRAGSWAPVAWHHLAVLLVWGLVGAAVAARLLRPGRSWRAVEPARARTGPDGHGPRQVVADRTHEEV